MSWDVVPHCDYEIGGKKCGRAVHPEPVRFTLDVRNVLELHLCDEHYAILDAVYKEFEPFARHRAVSSIIKQLSYLEDEEPPLYTYRLVGTSKKRGIYTLLHDSSQWPTREVRDWLIDRGLMPLLGGDGKKKRGKVPDDLAREWARVVTEELISERSRRQKQSA